ncbi:MAG TPA: hypothetical protein VMW50_09975 [Dehalococcoidia bacterium]|nr:hypothetical protein [Dehalococcoidia bacterium]
MASAYYYRVTIKEGKGVHRFWAKDRRRGTKKTLYTPVNNEGDDYSHYKGGTAHIRKDRIDNRLIIKEQPAIMDKKYGTLKVK